MLSVITAPTLWLERLMEQLAAPAQDSLREEDALIH